MASSIICRSLKILLSPCKFGGARTMTSIVGSDKSSPWLMLSPGPGDNTAYKFYSLSEEKIVSMEKSVVGVIDDDAELVGSSRGWLALLNRRNNGLFLSNPCSRRHFELPGIDGLPSTPTKECRILSKVIISTSSPDSEECYAMMIFGHGNKLGVCTLSYVDWSPIGDPYLKYQLGTTIHLFHSCARVYEDMVYLSKLGLMICMRPFELDLVSFTELDPDFPCEIETWEILDPKTQRFNFWFSTPLYTSRPNLNLKKKIGENTRSWVEENKDLLHHQCVQIPHLVHAEELNILYIVMRFVVLLGPDGTPLDRVPHCPMRGLRGCYPCQTVGFIVLQDDGIGCETYEVVDDLNGLAMFLGVNDSVAISVSDHCPELEPNSIYFTDAKRLRMLDGRHDTGVFNYMNKTMSPIIIQGSERVESSLSWFTPS